MLVRGTTPVVKAVDHQRVLGRHDLDAEPGQFAAVEEGGDAAAGATGDALAEGVLAADVEFESWSRWPWLRTRASMAARSMPRH